MDELELKAKTTYEILSQIEGVRCSKIMGSFYCFPQIFLPEKAIAEARVSSSARVLILKSEYYSMFVVLLILLILLAHLAHLQAMELYLRDPFYL